MPAGKTKAELEAEISEVEEENQELQDRLDAVADLVSGDDQEEEEEAADDESGDDVEKGDQD